jgi:hypothetical protein
MAPPDESDTRRDPGDTGAAAVPTRERLERREVRPLVEALFAEATIRDMHTHVYPGTFGTPVANRTGVTDASGLMLWGIDELVTYHYLVAEVYRVATADLLPYDRFWRLTKAEQADHIWHHLFVERTPISEACRGILNALRILGLDPADGLPRLRRFFAEQDPGDYIDRVMELARIERITMTNAVFDDNERRRWLEGGERIHDPRFEAVLRIDPMLRDWPSAASRLSRWGYAVGADLNEATIREARRFLASGSTGCARSTSR